MPPGDLLDCLSGVADSAASDLQELRMVMMLLFLTGLVAVWFGMRGKRRPCVAFWLIALMIFAAECRYLLHPSLVTGL